MYEITLDNIWWQLVKNGQKTVEGRLIKDHHGKVKFGDYFTIRNRENKEVIIGIVTFVRYYYTFRNMLLKEGLNNVIPITTNLQEALDIYYAIPGYREGEQKYGVVAIGLQVI
jgi:ASC-1-like (ASCH) protein